eukprot:scaffold276113_cov24-Prasinocladus_malaysianus.AAC.1
MHRQNLCFGLAFAVNWARRISLSTYHMFEKQSVLRCVCVCVCVCLLDRSGKAAARGAKKTASSEETRLPGPDNADAAAQLIADKERQVRLSPSQTLSQLLDMPYYGICAPDG